jgi:prophage regulatory protein
VKMLRYEDLRARGIPFSATHIHYLVKRGQFPRPIKLGYSTKRWVESEIDAWIAERAAARMTSGPTWQPAAQTEPAE